MVARLRWILLGVCVFAVSCLSSVFCVFVVWLVDGVCVFV